MKKFVLAAAAAAALVAGASPAAAQRFDHNRGNDRGQVTHNQQGNQHAQPAHNVQVIRYATPVRGGFNPAHRWNRGDRFDRRLAPNYQIVQRHAGLYAAPRGYQWVRSGNDAVLVSIASGLVGALIANLF